MALADHWTLRKPVLDKLFNPKVAPIERFERYFTYVTKRQKELLAEPGRVIGCMLTGGACAKSARKIMVEIAGSGD